jgi:L-lactate dehydrogenase complex protein LldG
MSKADIIQAIIRNKPSLLRQDVTVEARSERKEPTSEEKKAQFVRSVENAGGEVIEISRTNTGVYLQSEYPDMEDFTKAENRQEATLKTLHQLGKIEQAVLEARLGVAENGAIWLEDKDLPQRIIPFITQHLIIRIDASVIVADMREAYTRIELGDTGFGVFISGPSKTADIEQSLVYGAHGAIRLTVLLHPS